MRKFEFISGNYVRQNKHKHKFEIEASNGTKEDIQQWLGDFHRGGIVPELYSGITNYWSEPNEKPGSQFVQGLSFPDLNEHPNCNCSVNYNSQWTH